MKNNTIQTLPQNRVTGTIEQLCINTIRTLALLPSKIKLQVYSGNPQTDSKFISNTKI